MAIKPLFGIFHFRKWEHVQEDYSNRMISVFKMTGGALQG
jgi:hypothetical protein